MLKEVIKDDLEWVVSRLAEYNPVEILEIMGRCTISEIATASTIKMHDNSIRVRPPKPDV